MFRIDSQTWHGKILLSHFIKLFKRHGMEVSPAVKSALTHRFAISAHMAVVALKVLFSSVPIFAQIQFMVCVHLGAPESQAS